MKKRILSMLLALTMIMGIFTGCGTNGTDAGGSNASMEKITVSEMLANVVEENDGEVIIFEHSADSYKETYSEKTKWTAYSYDGKSTQLLYGANGERKTATNDLSLVDTSNPNTESTKNYRENVTLETISDREDDLVLYFEIIKIYFGKCEHVKINDESYMLFKTYIISESENKVRTTMFTLIKDTDFTKNKAVVVNMSDDTDGEVFTTGRSVKYVTNLTKEDKEAFGIE